MSGTTGTDPHSEPQTGVQTEPRSDSRAEPPGGSTPAGAIEALLMTADRPVAASKLAEVLAVVGGYETLDPAGVEAAIAELNAAYERSKRAFRIEKTAGGYRVMTTPEHAGVLAAFHRRRADGRLSRAAIETLAIIAYQQPVTRARLESIRGVACGEILRSLLEKRLVSVVGRAEELGRPMLYGTTKRFLEVFGIASPADLPASGAAGAPGPESS